MVIIPAPVYIALTNCDEFALIDPMDFRRVSLLRWYRIVGPTGIHYARATSQGHIPLHRFILQAPLGSIVDHKDRNGLNNCRSNLRFVTTAQNTRNGRKRVNSSSAYKGVGFHKRLNRWVAVLHLGAFLTEVEAAAAYQRAAAFVFEEEDG